MPGAITGYGFAESNVGGSEVGIFAGGGGLGLGARRGWPYSGARSGRRAGRPPGRPAGRPRSAGAPDPAAAAATFRDSGRQREPARWASPPSSAAASRPPSAAPDPRAAGWRCALPIPAGSTSAASRCPSRWRQQRRARRCPARRARRGTRAGADGAGVPRQSLNVEPLLSPARRRARRPGHRDRGRRERRHVGRRRLGRRRPDLAARERRQLLRQRPREAGRAAGSEVEGAADDRDAARREGPLAASRAGPRLGRDVMQDRVRRVAGVRHLLGEDLEQDRAQRVNVGPLVDGLLAARLLGGHVGRRAEDRSRAASPRSPRRAPVASRRRNRGPSADPSRRHGGPRTGCAASDRDG